MVELFIICLVEDPRGGCAPERYETRAACERALPQAEIDAYGDAVACFYTVQEKDETR